MFNKTIALAIGRVRLKTRLKKSESEGGRWESKMVLGFSWSGEGVVLHLPWQWSRMTIRDFWSSWLVLCKVLVLQYDPPWRVPAKICWYSSDRHHSKMIGTHQEIWHLGAILMPSYSVLIASFFRLRQWALSLNLIVFSSDLFTSFLILSAGIGSEWMDAGCASTLNVNIGFNCWHVLILSLPK